MRRLLSVFLFVAAAAFTLTPWATPSLGLAAGAVLALILGNPAPRVTARAAKWLLQAAIVGLGFGIPLGTVLSAGATGIGFTAFGIAITITLGLLLGRWLRVDWETSLLLTAGTSICGGSAIAAVGPAIGASTEAMSISLATVFVLNAVALYVFPPIGHLLHFSQHQFAVWSAIAIHDTSSVVGAASHYGPRALEEATVLKLTRTLWIIPFSIVAAAMARRRNAGAPGAARLTIPWFIGAFVLAALDPQRGDAGHGRLRRHRPRGTGRAGAHALPDRRRAVARDVAGHWRPSPRAGCGALGGGEHDDARRRGAVDDGVTCQRRPEAAAADPNAWLRLDW